MIHDLIYDVGMNNGDDTAYYLHKGFRVLAIEADPRLIAAARSRFADALAAGRLTLLDCGVSDHEQTATFWVCDDNSAWSAFDPALGQRTGKFHPVPVPCRTFASILAQFGVPHYLKVDIEGFEDLAIAALNPADKPAFVSREIGDPAHLLQLRDLGYNAFKIISQRTHHPLGAPAADIQWDFDPAAPADSAWKKRPAADGWSFPFGSAGPFADHTPGPWQSADSALHAFLAHRLGHIPGHPNDWFDVHATLRALPTPTPAPTPGQRLLALFQQSAQRLARPPRFWLFGAGQHTTMLLQHRPTWESQGFTLTGLIDDNPRLPNPHLGLPLLTRSQALASPDIDVVVLSTDMFTEHFWHLTADLRRKGIDTQKLYP